MKIGKSSIKCIHKDICEESVENGSFLNKILLINNSTATNIVKED